MMSVMDGETMCRTLKSDIETSHIPIILLTALGDKKDILRGLETKADMYIVKPFDLMVLKANISNILETVKSYVKTATGINQHRSQTRRD